MQDLLRFYTGFNSLHLIWNLHDNYFIHKVTMALKTTNYEVHVDCIQTICDLVSMVTGTHVDGEGSTRVDQWWLVWSSLLFGS